MKVIASVGRREFMKTGQLSASAKAALSVRIRADVAPAVTEVLKATAADQRNKTATASRDFFKDFLAGAEALVKDSGVAASFDPDRKSLFADRGAVKGQIAYSGSFIKFQRGVDWKKMRYDHYHRIPKSTTFFKKRGKVAVRSGRNNKAPQYSGSSRMEFLQLVRAWQGKASRIRSTQKKLQVSKDGKTVDLEFDLQFPNLGVYDYLRKAFVRARMYDLDVIPSRRYGLAHAERMRPFLRVYGVAAGNQYRRFIAKLK